MEIVRLELDAEQTERLKGILTNMEFIKLSDIEYNNLKDDIMKFEDSEKRTKVST